jgi:multidrug efflux pump subunit AcrA (membrane-fusion protein)
MKGSCQMHVSRSQRSKNKKINNQKPLKLGILIVGTIIIPLALASCSLSLNKSQDVKKVANTTNTTNTTYQIDSSNYDEVIKGNVSTTLSGIGQLVATKTTSVYFTNVSGPLSKLNFKINDQVKKGDLFAEILPTDIQYRLELQKVLVEKGRLKLAQMDDSQIKDLKKSIELTQMDLVTLLQQQETQPSKNETALKKAKLALEQFQSQMNTTEQANQNNIQKLKIRLEQIDNDIASAKGAIDPQQYAYDQLVGNNKIVETDDHSLAIEGPGGSRTLLPDSTAREIKTAKIKLEQLKLSLSNAEKNRAAAELDLKLAMAPQDQTDINSIQKSIDAAQLSLTEISKTNVERLDEIAQGIQKNKVRLEQLKLELEITQKNDKDNRQQSVLDQKSAELTLANLEQSLANSKLYSPVNGIVSFLDNISVTDIVNSGQLVAKIADPNKLVIQLTAADAKFVTGAKAVTLTIGADKYEVELYTPQAGDLLNQSNSGKDAGSTASSNIYATFKNKFPPLKFGDNVQAQLDLVKNDALVVPKTDVRVENGKILVDVLQGKEIKTVEITRGIETDTQVEVVGGLNLGDKIVRR